MAGGIAHDFRNILTIIFALGEAMQDHLPAEATELQPHQPSAQIPFLRKPWTLSELARRVRAVLDGEAGSQGAPAE